MFCLGGCVRFDPHLTPCLRFLSCLRILSFCMGWARKYKGRLTWQILWGPDERNRFGNECVTMWPQASDLTTQKSRVITSCPTTASALQGWTLTLEDVRFSPSKSYHSFTIRQGGFGTWSSGTDPTFCTVRISQSETQNCTKGEDPDQEDDESYRL